MAGGKNTADTVSLALGVGQIAVQMVAVYLAYRLTKIAGGFLAWYIVIGALVLMTVRRVTALMIEMGSIQSLVGSLAFIDRIVLPLAISTLLAYALFELVRMFERQSKPKTA